MDLPCYAWDDSPPVPGKGIRLRVQRWVGALALLAGAVSATGCIEARGRLQVLVYPKGVPTAAAAVGVVAAYRWHQRHRPAFTLHGVAPVMEAR